MLLLRAIKQKIGRGESVMFLSGKLQNIDLTTVGANCVRLRETAGLPYGYKNGSQKTC